MRKWWFIYVVLTVLVLAACAAPKPEIIKETVIVEVTQPPLPTYTLYPTYTPYPTPTELPTSTPKPLTARDLAPLLFQEGDMPAGVEAGQVLGTLPAGRLPKGAPEPADVVYLGLDQGNKRAGEVYAMLYADAETATKAFEAFLEDDTASATKQGWSQPLTLEAGEQGYMWGVFTGLGGFSHICFRRCNAVVFVERSDTINEDFLLGQATNLDERLAPEVCR